MMILVISQEIYQRLTSIILWDLISQYAYYPHLELMKMFLINYVIIILVIIMLHVNCDYIIYG